MFKVLRLICQQRQFSAVNAARQFSFKSDLSPETMYPNSKQKLFTPSPPPPRADNKFNGYIPMNAVTVTYSRSSGPGGQNVNKLDTKVDLRFHVKTSEWIPEAVREKLLITHKNQINKEGYFVVKSDLTRYQHMNLADALERVRNIIRQLEEELTPKELSPEKLAKIQRQHEKSARERLFIKRQKSQVKVDRQYG
ncbi:peptidyl-tRNA hydrolase ICT1, mitochondrial isoform X2 [Contarinia nasturtii]|uniref:peptidyl-tRNA hydrolase ICT1, mitochondrial isoform X2 n=1 Tax=Contarinia nasturtii TaxID=265458 RepID=UPI0012D491A9|nr:peptidyl-tRNA hydrolase ICT1, mitochondrial isoform X2 [Contarinia nasturtii]